VTAIGQAVTKRMNRIVLKTCVLHTKVHKPNTMDFRHQKFAMSDIVCSGGVDDLATTALLPAGLLGALGPAISY